MNTRISLLTAIITSAVLLAFSSCKTTEANYRAAYETARQSQYTGIDSTVYAKIRQEAVPSTVTVGGDSIHMKTEFVIATGTKGQPTQQVMRYGVVTGQFKQVFNARAMLKRLTDHGYTGAYIVETREPLFYVIAKGSNDLDQAVKDLKEVGADKNIGLRAPMPWLLQSARHNR